MDKNAMAAMQNHLETRHWWGKGRREIIRRVIQAMQLPNDAAILEIGCGFGGNLNVLADFGKVEAIEINDNARAYASSTFGVNVYKGWLPDGLGAINDHCFDLICLLDVLEHVEDDETSLCNIRKHLMEGRKIFAHRSSLSMDVEQT